MKHLILICLFAFISCAHKTDFDKFKTSSYDTSKQISVLFFMNNDPKKPNISPAKRVVRHYSAQDGLDSESIEGKYIVKVKQVTDTIYLISTPDSTLIYKDTTGKPIPDSTTHKPQYLPSYRNPIVYPSQLVTETRLITFPNIK